jgi:hypothetical protein
VKRQKGGPVPFPSPLKAVTEGAYLVRELVRGRTLTSELKLAGKIHPSVAAVWFDQVLEGVKAAHSAERPAEDSHARALYVSAVKVNCPILD